MQVPSLGAAADAAGPPARPLVGPATKFLVAANLLLFVGPWIAGRLDRRVEEALAPWLWNTPRLVREKGYAWQVLTGNFVHGSVLALSINMLFVVWFGSRLERAMGSWRFAGFYLMAGIFSHLVYDLGAPVFGAERTSGGASGCVLAILVFHALQFPRYVVHLFGFLAVPFWWIAALFVLSDVSSFFPPGGIPGINSIVHLSGATFGALYWLVGRPPPHRDADERS